MFDYDLHIHTEYCGHADGMTVGAIISAAEQAGLATIAITDHIFSVESLKRHRLIAEEVSRYDGDLRIIVGAEVDVDGMRKDGGLVIDDLGQFDYCIGALHYVPTVGNYAMGPEECTLSSEEVFECWRSTVLGLVGTEGVDTFAHPGRMIGTAVELDVYFDDIIGVLAEAAEVSAANNVSWELNELTGARLSEYWRGQWHRIYEPAVRAGVKLVYGSDAHSPVQIGVSGFVDSVLERLAGAEVVGPVELGLV